MKILTCLIALVSLGLWAGGCGESPTGAGGSAGDGHTHADGSTHDDHDDQDAGAPDAPHAPDAGTTADDHDPVAIGSAMIGELEVEFGQGHGVVSAGKESHLVVKLPYTDSGASVVRAWLGTEDRTLSVVGRGEYEASGDHYNVHATAPDPLPANVMWWIEIEKPDGTISMGMIKPRLE